MVFRLKKKTDDILLENPLDDVIELDEEGEKVEAPRKQNYLHFIKNRKYLITIVGGISFFVLILIIVACTYSRVSTDVFNARLIKYLDDDFTELDKETKDLHVDELTEIYRRGLISDDHVYEFSIYKEFHEFNQKYQKTHEDLDDKIHRFTNFRDNYIESKIERSHETYVKGLSKYSDLSKDEFMSLFPPISGLDKVLTAVKSDLSCPAQAYTENKTYLKKLMAAKGLDKISDICEITGEGMDWRCHEGVTPIRNQGNCGSCWAFAAVGAVEAAYKVQKGLDLSLSPQELINCETESHGCDGGDPFDAIFYVKGNGISYEEDVPYKARDELCVINSAKKVSIKDVASATGYDIIRALLPLGPVIVGVAADHNWLLYSSGVYNGPCAAFVNHAVLLVGEGYDEELDKHYWVIKNSWGPDWGENGYIRLERNDTATDKCGVLTVGSVPIIQT